MSPWRTGSSRSTPRRRTTSVIARSRSSGWLALSRRSHRDRKSPSMRQASSPPPFSPSVPRMKSATGSLVRRTTPCSVVSIASWSRRCRLPPERHSRDYSDGDHEGGMDAPVVGQDGSDRDERELPPFRRATGGHDPDPGRGEQSRGRERDTAHQTGDRRRDEPASREGGDRNDDERRQCRRRERERRADDTAHEKAERGG